MLDYAAYALAGYTVLRWVLKAIYALVSWNDRMDKHRAWIASRGRGMARNPRYSPAGLQTFGPAHGHPDD